jgi:hypothetical protein
VLAVVATPEGSTRFRMEDAAKRMMTRGWIRGEITVGIEFVAATTCVIARLT